MYIMSYVHYIWLNGVILLFSVSPVDMDSHIEGEDVVHYVYET